jgi:hypothetical protein
MRGGGARQHADATHAMAKAMAEGDIDLPTAYTPEAINAIRLVQMDLINTPFPPQPPNSPYIPHPPGLPNKRPTWNIYVPSPPPLPPPAPPDFARHKSDEQWGCAKPRPFPPRMCRPRT